MKQNSNNKIKIHFCKCKLVANCNKWTQHINISLFGMLCGYVGMFFKRYADLEQKMSWGC